MIIDSIREKLKTSLNPVCLEVHNDSHLHRGPANRETHFRVFAVSEAFEGKSRIERQRMIHEQLKFELQNGVHALSIKAKSPAEHSSDEGVQEAMKCFHTSAATRDRS